MIISVVKQREPFLAWYCLQPDSGRFQDRLIILYYNRLLSIINNGSGIYKNTK